MKKRVFKSILILSSIIILFTGCSKDGILQLPSLKAKLNGTDWVSTFRATTHATVSGTECFLITATNMSAASGFSNGEYLAILVRGNDVNKPYSLSATIAGGKFETEIVYYDQGGSSGSGSPAYTATSGTITFTKVDMSSKTLSGTFSYTLTNGGTTKAFTEGKFENIHFIDGSIPNAK